MASPPSRLRSGGPPAPPAPSSNLHPATLARCLRSNPGIPLSQIRINSNLSVHVLRALADTCTPEQQRMLEAAGLSFVLHLPRGYKVHRPRALWLLARLRHNGDGLVLGVDGRGEVPVTRDAVFDILGIAGGDTPVQPADGAGRPTGKASVAIGRYRLNISVRKAREVAEAIAGSDSMSSDDRRAFLAAVVILAVGFFLAPTATNCGEVDGAVLEAVTGNSSVGSYDWQGFVLNRLAVAAAQVRSQIGQGCPERKILLSGCTTFLLLFYYSRCIGISFPKRVAGAPMISCFDGAVLKELDRVDQQRREQFHSWNVMTNKRHFDGEEFLRLINPRDNNEAPQVVVRGSRIYADVGSFAAFSRVAGLEPFVNKADTQMPKDAQISMLVENHVADMVQKVTTELAEKHGDMFGGPQALIYGNEKLVAVAFDKIEAGVKKLKMMWGGAAACFGTSSLDAYVGAEVGTSRTIIHDTPTVAEKRLCIEETGNNAFGYEGTGKNVMPSNSGTHKECANVLNPGASGSSTVRASLGAVKAEMPWGEVTNEQTPGSRKGSIEGWSTGMGVCTFDKPQYMQEFLTPGSVKCSSQSWSAWGGMPIFDKSFPIQGSGSVYSGSGLDLLAEAMAMQAGTVKRKRSGVEGPVEYGQLEHRGSAKEASMSMVYEKSMRLPSKAFEALMVEFHKDEGIVGALQGELEKNNFRAGIRDRAWVQFGTPVQVDVSGDQFLYHFASGKPWDLRMMAAVTAVFKELDDKVYQHIEGPRTRFFVDPRIMGGYFFGAREYEAGEWCELLEKPYFSFEPTECEMGVVPVLMEGGWMCLALHLKEKKVTVFQPNLVGAPDLFGMQMVSKISEKILAPILHMLGAAAGVCYPVPAQWVFERFPWCGPPISRYTDQQAVVVSMFALLFDGKKVLWDMFMECASGGRPVPPTKPTASFKWTLCSHLLMRQGNETLVQDILYG